MRFCSASRLHKQKGCFSSTPEDQIYQEDGYDRKNNNIFRNLKGIKRKRE